MTDTAKEYARALYELAEEEKAEKAMLDELGAVYGILRENPEYCRLLDAPNIAADERLELVSEAFSGKIGDLILNFMKLLVEKRIMHQFEKCFKAYRKLYNTANNTENVTIITAVALNEEQRVRLVSKLESITGKKLLPEYSVDKACLGGVIVRFESSQIDGSVKRKLDMLGQKIVSATA